ncbi:MAG: hypothetical protein AABP62_01210 [Planctomycetota bacterium]
MALAPLVHQLGHQLGTVCLHPAAAVANELLEPDALEPTPANSVPTLTPVDAPKRAGKKEAPPLDEYVPGLSPDNFNQRNGATPTQNSDAADQRKSQNTRRRVERTLISDHGELVEKFVVVEEPADTVTETATNSAEVFLELSKHKAALLTPEEMAREVDSLRKELPELRATVQLREAVGKLKQLIGEHPQSQAAQRAKRMLDVETIPSGLTLPAIDDNGPFDSNPATQPKQTLEPVNSLPTY